MTPASPVPGIPGGAEERPPKPDAATVQRLLSAMGLPPDDRADVHQAEGEPDA